METIEVPKPPEVAKHDRGENGGDEKEPSIFCQAVEVRQRVPEKRKEPDLTGSPTARG